MPLLGGRSNRVWRAGDLVVKLYLNRADNPLFDNDPSREISALEALSGTGMVPALVASGQFEGCSWLAYSHITGAPWQSDTPHVAQLLGRLHDQSLMPDLPMGRNGSRQLEQQSAAILARCPQDEPLLALLQDLRPIGQVPPNRQRVLIHGDPVPGNLLAHDGTLTLIDWQCPQHGDPAEDLALFLSPAMQFLYRGTVLAPQESEAFLAAYPDPRIVGRYLALRPWFHWRMAAYCLWRSQGGAPLDRSALELEVQALRRSIIPSRA